MKHKNKTFFKETCSCPATRSVLKAGFRGRASAGRPGGSSLEVLRKGSWNGNLGLAARLPVAPFPKGD